MGTILTSYGDAAYDHEGYADRLMPSGEYSGSEWSSRYPPDAHVAFVAACACGWRGTTKHPPSDKGEELALDDWELSHARPVLERAQDIELERLQAQLRDLAAIDLTRGDRSSHVRAEQLLRTLRRLSAAAELAGQLHRQAQEQDKHERPQ